MKNIIIASAWGLLCLFLLVQWNHETSIDNSKKQLIKNYQSILASNKRNFQSNVAQLSNTKKSILYYNEVNEI